MNLNINYNQTFQYFCEERQESAFYHKVRYQWTTGKNPEHVDIHSFFIKFQMCILNP